MAENWMFRSELSETMFYNKYAHQDCETWPRLARTMVEQVCGGLLPREDIEALVHHITYMRLIPGGRYLYYAGRPNKFWNNCYIFISQDDTREDWADTSWKHESALMTGGGTGNDYSVYREEGAFIRRTGGFASGPVPKMNMTNEQGRRVMQGGSRRSALYASLARTHPDVFTFMGCKNWDEMYIPGTSVTYWDVKQHDFNFPAPMDMTNISVNYQTDWLQQVGNQWTGDPSDPVFKENVKQALRTGEPGFSFNFWDKEDETGRNACTEVTSASDSDVCNLASLNVSRIETIEQMEEVTELATKFLLCGSIRAHLPFDKVYQVREQNRRLGLGLMGVHEWLMQRGYRYEVTEELHQWLAVYRDVSDSTSEIMADWLGVSRPVANRAIAPTGTIAMIAGTTGGIEPLFSVAHKRRYLRNGTEWYYQYTVDHAAQELIQQHGLDPDEVESALDLAKDPERRIKFQADIQDYVDMGISSTINLPQWGTDHNNEDKVDDFAATLAWYAPRLRGFTCYPDGSRGGQPLTPVSYHEAVSMLGQEFRDNVQAHDVCDMTGGGVCGI